MQLPNKLYSYKESTLALIPKVLKRLSSGPVDVTSLYEFMKKSLNEPTDFFAVMDCVYALGVVDMNDDGEVFLC